MEKILNSFFDTADAAELAAFDSELAHITEACTADGTDAILSAALEKAGMKPKLVKTKKRKSRKLFILIAAAVVVLSAVGFTVFFDKLDVYFGISDKGSPFVGEFYKKAAEAENEDIKLIVDGIFSDDERSYLMVSMHAKTMQGRQYIYNVEHMFDEGLTAAGVAVGKKIEEYRAAYPTSETDSNSYFFVQDGSRNFVISGLSYSRYNTPSAYYLLIRLDNSKLDQRKPVKLIEVQTELSLDVDVSVNTDTVKLVADGEDCFHNVTLSPMAVYIRHDSRDTRFPSSIHGECTAQLSNGETIVLGITGQQSDPLNLSWEDAAKQSYTDLLFHEPTPLEDVVSVSINGVKYYKEDVKS